ncbi:Asparagine synthase (glutamine-hydrolyzing) [Flagellimonas maritima]|uniref:asparagine synthase (glutamine-hydrolyzing) n=1 Tax=Flagellimonas maritima TaxID=1383885 RepID=A0A2Z4LNY2_9FLAO|nr:asparagine synthase B [Allomuricauda aurantiaca]AWX43575.1 Asparagine synthase (glutamine-hydrolyzing) [Allomuricauda aurantiaca]
MCGIVCAFDIKESSESLRPQLLEMSKKVRHRGPDWSGIYADGKTLLAHERLAIVDPASGKQPLFSVDGKLVLAANGEIYNHRELRKQFEGNYEFRTQSDCEVILALYQQKGPDFLDDLNGIFGFALYDSEKDEYFIARDHMGIIPLYIGWDKNGTFYVASELKALEGICSKIELFPPGHYLHSSDGEFKKWYTRDWMEYEAVKENETSISEIRDALEAAVHRQLMSDVPYGVLLSGGLDSSVTSAIAKKYSQKRIESGDTKDAWWPQLHSFSVGLEGSPDLAAAQKVANHIGTIHHEIKFTIQEGLDAIKDVIYNLETYDITTIRASTPMYLMARVIKSMGIKMVLSGEGADELFGGYLYFHKAPSPKDFHEETVRKLDKLHMYDCLRANKSLAAWGIEGRVPFLDKEFMDVAMRINPKDKMINGERMEKWVVRKAFESYLPESVVWRQKEQFSDGVGYSWIDTLKSLVEMEISDEQLANAHFKFPIQTPTSKEEYYYRSIFEGHFPSDAAASSVPQEPSVACSTKIALEWDEAFKNMNDPSGRAVANVHEDAYAK